MSEIVAVGSESVLKQFRQRILDRLLERQTPFELARTNQSNLLKVINTESRIEILFDCRETEIAFSTSEEDNLRLFHTKVLEPIADTTGGLALVTGWVSS